MKRIRVLLADDHQIMLDGLALMVNSQHDMEVVAQASNGREACEQAHAVKPDVAVLDLSMPGMNGLKVAETLQQACPPVKVLALSMHEDESYLRELVRAKAAGFVLKRSAADELLQAIRKVAGGGAHFDHALATSALCDQLAKRTASGKGTTASLTEKEESVLRLIAWGHTNKEIALKLSVSPKTIETYKARLARKLGLHTRAEMVRYALRRGWLNEADSGISTGARP